MTFVSTVVRQVKTSNLLLSVSYFRERPLHMFATFESLLLGTDLSFQRAPRVRVPQSCT